MIILVLRDIIFDKIVCENIGVVNLYAASRVHRNR